MKKQMKSVLALFKECEEVGGPPVGGLSFADVKAIMDFYRDAVQLATSTSDVFVSSKKNIADARRFLKNYTLETK